METEVNSGIPIGEDYDLKKLISTLAVLFLLAFLTGCGKKDDELEQYKAQMSAFTNKINELGTSIDNIDPASETRTQELLQYLDEMDAAFAEMGAMEVPEQFANIDELADDASANLSKSVSLYHQAFDDDSEYDPDLVNGLVDAALEYYSRAFKRLGYIGTILQGELPEDETITIIHESDEQEDQSDSEDDNVPEDAESEISPEDNGENDEAETTEDSVG